MFIILDVVWNLMQIAGQYFCASSQGADYTGDSSMFSLGVSNQLMMSSSIPFLIDNFHCVAVYTYFPCWKCSSSYYPYYCVYLHLRHLPSLQPYPQRRRKCQQRSYPVSFDPSRFNSDFYYCWIVLLAAYHEDC